MRQLLLRFWRWLGGLLGTDAPSAPTSPGRYRRETNGLPADRRRTTDDGLFLPQHAQPQMRAADGQPPAVPLPPSPPPQLDLHTNEPAQFGRKQSILTKPEGLLYRSLVRVVAGRYQVMAKVRLWDFIWLNNHPPERRQLLGNLSCRHVDFLLCETHTLKPLLVIELDDSSHLKPEAQAADQFKDAVFAAAGLPLLRLDRPDYSATHLRDRIAACLEPTPALETE